MTLPPILEGSTRPPRRTRLVYIMGAVVLATAAAMIPGLVTALIYQEWSDAGAFIASATADAGGGGAI